MAAEVNALYACHSASPLYAAMRYKAAMQIAQARARAAAAHTNETAFLQEIARTNEETNAHALDRPAATAPRDPALGTAGSNLDTFGNPTTAPSNLTFLTELGSNAANAASGDSAKAQQLHDLGMLQKDAVLLEEGGNTNNHIPLGSSASTVDLSPAAQSIANAGAAASTTADTPLPSMQLAQMSSILQPLANEPLTPALLQQIQSQLTAGQNPLQLSLTTLALAMNLIAGMQTSPNHAMENTFTTVDDHSVAPVLAIDKVAVEDSAILP